MRKTVVKQRAAIFMVEDESLALLPGSSEDFYLWLDDIGGMSWSGQRVSLCPH